MSTKPPRRGVLLSATLVLAVAGCSTSARNGQGAGGASAGNPPIAPGTSGTGAAGATGGSAAQEPSAPGGAGGTSGVSGSSAIGQMGGGAGTGGNPNGAGPNADGGGGARGEGGADAKDASAPDAAPHACAGSLPALKPGNATVTMQSGGRSRSYIQHVPSGLAAGAPLAVVIDLHGAGGNGKQQQGLSGFNALADQEKFLAVFPDGVDGYWNVDDTCCGTAGKQKVDDVGFLKAIITQLSAETCIDNQRIYVSGFSNGGGLAHRMGCEAADVVAAIAPNATDLRTDPCNPARPISMMEVKGLADSLEPYDGGLVGPAGGQYVAVGAKASQKLWADIDHCTGTATTSDQYCANYTQCADGVEVDLCSLPNTDHSTYGNSLGFNVASVIWKMFKRQKMK